MKTTLRCWAIIPVRSHQQHHAPGQHDQRPYSLTWTPAFGNYLVRIYAKATDNLGVVTTSAKVPGTVIRPPTVALTSTSSGARFGAPATNFTITASATPAPSSSSSGISEPRTASNTCLGLRQQNLLAYAFGSIGLLPNDDCGGFVL